MRDNMKTKRATQREGGEEDEEEEEEEEGKGAEVATTAADSSALAMVRKSVPIIEGGISPEV